MADIIIVPDSSIMSFTSSANYTQTLTQDASGSLILLGSGSTGRTDIFTINGNNGTLFSVSDDLSDSLFSVNTVAGLPVIEAFADNTVKLGKFGAEAIVISGSNNTLQLSGSIKAVSLGTAADTNVVVFNTTTKQLGYNTSLSLQGATGTQGAVGTQGTVGGTGAQGTVGTQGNVGGTGAQGAVGTQGTVGGTGTQGTVGTQGNVGGTGAQGAVGTQGTVGGTGTQGTVGTQGTQGVQGRQGIAGDKGGIPYIFSTTTTDSDPGIGTFRFNSGTINSVTQIFIDNLDDQTISQTTWYDTWDDSTSTIKGYLTIQVRTPSVFEKNIWAVTAVTAASGYYKITVSYVSGMLFTSGDLVAISFSRTGDNGTQGTTGAQGTTGTATQGTTGAQGTTGTATQGTTGAQGTTGTATQGTTGAQGAVGTATQGTTGAQGAVGTATQGTTGAQGAVGTATQGTTGAQGAVGTATQGTTGAQGAVGTATQGTTGTQGAVGTATQGTTGAQGAVGTATQGTTGTQGIQGIAGGGGSIPGSNNEMLTSDGAGAAVAESNLTFDGATLSLVSNTEINGANGYLRWQGGTTFYGGGVDINLISGGPVIRQGVSSVNRYADLQNWSDQTYFNGLIIGQVDVSATSGVSPGQLLHLTTGNNWEPADADTQSATKLLGICVESAGAEGITTVLLNGIYSTTYHDQLGLTVNSGAPLYVSTTNTGYVTETAPTQTGDFVRLIGHNIYNNGDRVIVRFDPDNTWIAL